ncbi:LacI family DNA-binding transcriptional regulator [Litchfieldella xinjiangensis]|uniref:LacI family DNA-binding transcriptional regulator n=1 Tax=Litchfieldella xinjiangensis TaxID=1166948 RepID=UPI0005BB449F|nr:LacI family DNA-binding transcriptional regulator [Halomonas xinjiangensis]
MSKRKPQTRPRRGSDQPTLAQVAQMAGVSPITASRALNDPEKVNEATRDRVFQVMEHLGYVPNLIAGSLASSRSRFIAVIVPSLVNTVFLEVIKGLQDTFEAAGYQILLGNTNYDIEREHQLVRTFLGWSCSALVTAGLKHNPACRRLLQECDRPVMEVMELGEALDLNVGLDHHEAGRCMASHLLARGYRQPIYVGARLADDYRAGMRYAGHSEVLEAAGIASRLIDIDQPGSLEEGAKCLERVRQDYPDADVIHFANDDLATGALLHALRLGIQVPDEIAIAGFNGLPLGQYITPRLTTILSPRETMGRVAAEEILKRLAGKRVTRRKHDVGFQLLNGKST